MNDRVLKELPRTRRVYPWQRWADGQVWEVKLSDWNVNATALRSSLYAYASRHGQVVSVRETEKGKRLAFQFTPVGNN